jgi:acetyl-CoA acetyltransferase
MAISKDVWDRAALVGVGYSPITRGTDATILDLALEACLGALEQAGFDPKSIDGICTFSYGNDSVPSQAVATALALDHLDWAVDSSAGGQAPCHLVIHAAMAIATGAASNVLVYRALRGRSGARVGTMLVPGAAAEQRYAIGLDAYAQNIALWARRYLIETGHEPEDLGVVPVAQRQYALHNPRAINRRALTYEMYLDSPMIAEPFRLHDCTMEVDGACAVLVTSADRAKDARFPAVKVLSGAYALGGRSGQDASDTTLWRDVTRNYTSVLAPDLWGQAGLRPHEVDMAQIYDCFSSSVLISMEGLGLAERGGAVDLIRSGATGAGGRLPVNTNGGLLSEGYLHGMNSVAEAVLQLQGEGAVKTTRTPETCVVTSGAMMDGSALVLARA